MIEEVRNELKKIEDAMRANGEFATAEAVKTLLYNDLFKPCYICHTPTRYTSNVTGEPCCGGCLS